MNSALRTEVTELLHAWNQGDRKAEEKLWPILYAELKRMARRELRQERSSHTLQSGALVNELCSPRELGKCAVAEPDALFRNVRPDYAANPRRPCSRTRVSKAGRRRGK